MKRISGQWVKTNLGAASYESFVPVPLPPNPPIDINSEILGLLVEANKNLALLNGLSTRIPNVSLFISMYVRKEALLSSQIEGTQATLDDILDPNIDTNKNQNVAEIINYIKAIEYSIDRLTELPLCNRLIKEAHAVLMEGTRGHEKTPGEFRRSQNWIGGYGSNLNTASYVPPTVENMLDAVAQLELYINNDNNTANDNLDSLIRAALIHYQFETIHPFLDGNGRIGRLLVTLYLMDRGVVNAPTLYLSLFLKQNRVEYYDRMTHVRTDGDYEQWVRFFLHAINESAKDAIYTIDKLIELHEKNIAIISKMGRARINAMKVFEYLETSPIIDVQKTAVVLSLTYNTVSAAVERLCQSDILFQTSNARRNRTFSYEAYLEILRSGT
ncbi:MAG: Fic family protein [Oscillospiraceae bacterium]|nr:Fic family protein [Oscillospiraceae bacterium]